MVCQNREAHSADLIIKPAITISEEYDDNIFLTQDNTTDDFVTRVVPSLSVGYKTAVWDLALHDTFYWWFYAKQNKGYYSNAADLTSKVSVIKNLLYFDVEDAYSSVVLNPRGPSTEENLNVNRSDTNTFNASPYVKYQLEPATALTVGYAYINIWYRNPEGINRQQHKGFLSIEHAFNPKVKFMLGAEYMADRPEDTEPDNDQTSILSSVFYNLDPRTSLDGTVGYRMFSFGDSADKNKFFYDVGLVYRLSKEGKIRLRASELFSASPTDGLVDTTSQKLTLLYGEAVSVDASVYHTKDNYFEIGQTDEAIGVSAGFTYTPNPRRTYRVSGGYERAKYKPQDEKRNIYLASAGIDHKLALKAVLSLIYFYNKSTGNLEDNNYTDNTVRLQVRIEI